MILIRTDANHIVATGHLMRCLSVADALKDRVQEEIVFCMADLSGKDMANDRGYRVIPLDGKWDDMLQEKRELEEILKANQVSMLLVDSYYVSEEYFRGLSELTRVVYIDDRKAGRYDLDLLVNYSIYAGEMGYEEFYENAKLLLGAKYTPLRKQFQKLPAHTFADKLRKVLILSGGTDKYGFQEKITRRLLEEISDLEITIISGNMNEYYEKLQQIAAQDNRVRLLSYVSEMAGHMCDADIAISATGTTMYELCACGTPMIGYGWADNHRYNIEKFVRDNLIVWGGDIRDGLEQCVENCVKHAGRLLSDAALCRKISRNQQSTVSGNGAENIANSLCEKFINQ